MYAVIQDRSRQAGVRVGDVLDCDLNGSLSEGDPIVFERVLLVSNEGEVRVGRPTVEGALVKGEVLGEVRGKKEVVFRFKRRKNVRRKQGHRQRYTRVRITAIEG